MRYLKTNNNNWRKLCKGEIQAEQLEINIKENKMAKKNPGKTFEEDFKKSVPEDCWLYRFKDGTANFHGQKNENVRFQAKNICDFQVMTNEYLFLLELKSHAKVSIGFDCIRENQIKQMSEIDHPKIKAYFIFNFRDIEKTYAIEARKVKEYIETAQRSSFPFVWCEENGIEIIGAKSRTRYKYDLEKFFNEMEEKVNESNGTNE